MLAQTYKNHRQLVPGFHYLLLSLLLGLLILGIVCFFNSTGETRIIYFMLTTIVVCLILTALFARTFGLKAQDRAIRAEENFRHFRLTGKPLDTRLTIHQIVALRFASDEEFVGLADKAFAEKWSSNTIKKAITNWRPDHHRV